MVFYRDLDMLEGRLGKKMQKCWHLRGRSERLGGGQETKADPQLHTASREKGNRRTEDEIPE